MRTHRKSAVTLLAAAVLFLATATPAAAAGRCSPGRSGTPGVLTTVFAYANGSNTVDVVRASFKDMDPFVKAGSRSYAYVELKDGNQRSAQIGWFINASGNRRIFVWVTQGDGDPEYYNEWRGDISQLDNGTLNGIGGEFHKFTVNRHDFGTGFQFLIDGNELVNTGPLAAWEPSRARVALETGDTASQFWGTSAFPAVVKHIEKEDPFVSGAFNLVDDSSIAHSYFTFSGANGIEFGAWDAAC